MILESPKINLEEKERELNQKKPDILPLHIAISGQSGCGNTTVGTLLSKKLHLKFVNFTFRNLAKELNLSFADLCAKAEKDKSYDQQIDSRQVELARSSASVLSSRLAIWMLPEADLKIYLYADFDVRARRISQREGKELEEIKKITHLRDMNDLARYKKLYDIDILNHDFVHLSINTSFYSPEEIVAIIISSLSFRDFTKE